jgi:topoisomerase IV subunit A
MIHVEKWMPEKPMNVVYFDGEKETWMVKRFIVEPQKGLVRFITENAKSKLGVATTLNFPNIYIRFNKKFKQAANKLDETVSIAEFITVKGLKAIGNKLSNYPILSVDLLESDTEREKKADEEILALRPKPAVLDSNEPTQNTLF